MKATVAIIGGGLSGLCAAKYLQRLGIETVVLEKSSRIGGRASTDEVEGFKLDRGFQVLLSSYPAARREFNFDSLGLHPFTPGAIIWSADSISRIYDPIRVPSGLWSTLSSDIFSLADQLLIARLTHQLKNKSISSIYSETDIPTLSYLQQLGFSQRAIEGFFRPFFGGVFLEHSLTTSRRMFEFTFKMFSEGSACLPREGMGSLAKDLAATLSNGSVLTESGVTKIKNNTISTQNYEDITAERIIVATDWVDSIKLLSENPSGSHIVSNGTLCHYFAAPTPPFLDKMLMLDPCPSSPIQHLCIPTNICASYSRDGRSLISVSSTTRAPSEASISNSDILKRLTDYFGDIVGTWEPIRTYWIPHALAHQPSGRVRPRYTTENKALFLAGDYLENSSINGALESGRNVADAVALSLGFNRSNFIHHESHL